MNENKTIEILFEHFTNAPLSGEIAEAMHKISGAIDAAIEAGDMDTAIELTGDHELAAMRYGFYAGFLAGLELRQAMQGAA